MTARLVCTFIFCSGFLISGCNSSESGIDLIKYQGIDRFIGILEKSSFEKPADVSILFYGQSIVAGLKSDILVDSLRQIFPSANIRFQNTAIGSFKVPSLLKTANHDVYNENPDLIIFHAYDGIEDGLLDSLIKSIRWRMSSDIAILNHHYVWNTNPISLMAENKRDSIQSVGIQKVASKYGCLYIDVRTSWKEYLEKNNMAANKLIGNTIDSDVHPNDDGKQLLREIILASLLEKKGTAYSATSDMLFEELSLSRKISYTEKFIGNRVEIELDTLNDPNTEIVVLIDGKRPSSMRNSYYITRPGIGYKSWMPAVKLISLGVTFPRVEDWKLIITEINREKKYFKYRVVGSITGYDGEGTSEADFVSNTKRIKINKEDFHLFRTEEIIGLETPIDFEIKFSVKLAVEDTIKRLPNNSRHTVFRDFEVDEHSLKLKVLQGQSRPNKVIIYQPYLARHE